jgi:hypothetical protein
MQTRLDFSGGQLPHFFRFVNTNCTPCHKRFKLNIIHSTFKIRGHLTLFDSINFNIGSISCHIIFSFNNLKLQVRLQFLNVGEVFTACLVIPKVIKCQHQADFHIVESGMGGGDVALTR